MDILYLLSQLPEKTGSGIYTRALIGEAVKAGHRCFLVAACQAGQPPDLAGIEADFIHLVEFGREPVAFPIPGMSDVMPYMSSRFMDLSPQQIKAYEEVFENAVRTAVEVTKPDIIHSNHLWIMSAMVRRLFPDVPMVVSCHGTGIRQFRNCPHLRENLLRDIPDVDGVFALSQSQKKEIEGLFGIPGHKIHVAPNGYNPDHFYKGENPASPPYNIIYAGKLASSKGVPILLESIGHSLLRDMPVHLYLAGSGTGPDKDLCHALAADHPGRVTFCGMLSPSDLGHMMRKSHVFILPSFFEGLPLVLIEALASGCRIVATDLPGIRELVSDLGQDWGELVELPPLETTDKPYDTDIPTIRERLAQAIYRQLTFCRPDNDHFGRTGDMISSKYSWQEVFRRVEAIYKTLVRR